MVKWHEKFCAARRYLFSLSRVAGKIRVFRLLLSYSASKVSLLPECGFGVHLRLSMNGFASVLTAAF
jgi:hypothetical protein